MAQLLPIPTMLDRRAEADPDRVWARHPVSATSYTEGFQAVTYGQMCTAVKSHRPPFGRQTWREPIIETLAYIGPNDLRYHIVLVTAIKMGYKVLIETSTLNLGLQLIQEQMFFPSPRNSIVAQKDLLASTECRILLTPDPEPLIVTGLLRENPVSRIQIPSLEELFKHDDAIIPYFYVHEQKPLDVILSLF